jgi:hypothetical protein
VNDFHFFCHIEHFRRSRYFFSDGFSQRFNRDGAANHIFIAERFNKGALCPISIGSGGRVVVVWADTWGTEDWLLQMG